MGAVAPDSVAGELEAWWHWNRTRYLARPRPARPVAVAASAGGRATTTAAGPTPVERSWLLAATAASDPEDRAGAAYALGCAGPAAGGIDRLAALLADGSPVVQRAAVLGLGEHGGTRARFLLARAIATAGSDERLAAVATLALGLAAADDGALPGASLRAAVAATAIPAVREAGCAAADLCGSDCLHDLAAAWLSGPLGAEAQANAVRSAVVTGDVPRAWFAASEAVRLAALAELVRGHDVDAAFVRQQLESPSSQRDARAVLVVAGWRDFPSLAAAGLARPTVRLAYGFGLAVHVRGLDLAAVGSQVALAERADHVAEHRPLWLVARALARDPSVEARARIVLGDVTSDERLRRAAVDVLALVGDTATLRELIVWDTSPHVRWRAADACARAGTDADVACLKRAASLAVADDERAALLVALGRTRVAAAVPMLRDAAQAAPAAVRRGAWLGLAHWLRWRGETPLARLAQSGGHTWQPRWLLDVVDAVR